MRLATSRGAALVAGLLLLGNDASVAAATRPWRATALVTTTSSIPDLPGGRFVDFGSVYARPGGELVFWAKLAGREEKQSWALFSLRDGALKTILEEGEEVASRYSAEPGRKFHVHATGIWHPVTALHNGKRLAFTSSSGALGRDAAVFGWDGEAIRPLIAPGQPIEIAGRNEPIEGAGVVASAPSGELLVSLRTVKPFKTVASAIYDGETLRPVLPKGLGGAAASPAWNNVRLLPGGECLAVVETGKRGSALIHETAAGTRRLLETGAPHPFSPGEITGITLQFAKSASRFVVLLWAEDGSSTNALYDGDKAYSLAPPEAQGAKRWGFGLQQGDFLLGDSPAFVYKGELDMSTYSKLDPRGTQVYLFDGTAVRRLTDSRVVGVGAAPLTRIARLLEGAYPGALVNANLSGTGPSKTPDLWPLYYLDSRDLAAGLQPVPQLEVEDGQRISLEAVRVWLSSTAAIVWVPGDGLYRLDTAPALVP